MTKSRRRIDLLREPEFLEGLDALGLDELRQKRGMAEEVETELSFYRRLLHGRMDLLSFELARRAGQEERALMDVLPEVLGGGEMAGGQAGRIRGDFFPELPDQRRRRIDRVLADDFLTRMAEMELAELEATQEVLTDTEGEISEQRRTAQIVFDTIQAEITARYRSDLSDVPVD